MRGRSVPISIPRRLVGDLMHLSTRIPRVTVQRRMQICELAAARDSAISRPPWAALFVRAYALLAQERVELRRAYVSLPWPSFYEYPESVASITHEREFRGEKAVLQSRLKSPSRRSISEISAHIRNAQTAPLDCIPEFKSALRFARAPRAVRRSLMWLGLNVGRQRANYFGTFHFSVYSGLGAESLNPLSPLTTLLNYGPIALDGVVNVRILYDHRVMDGATVARALQRLEEILNGPVAQELRDSGRLAE